MTCSQSQIDRDVGQSNSPVAEAQTRDAQAAAQRCANLIVEALDAAFETLSSSGSMRCWSVPTRFS